MLRIALYIFIFVLVSSTAHHAAAPVQKTSAITEGVALVKKAYLYYSKDLFLQALEIFRNITGSEDDKNKALYYTAYAEYKLVEMSLQKGNEDLFDKYYDTAEKHAEQLSEIGSYSAEGKTLLAGIYMMKIANSPLSAVTLTGQIHSLLDEAQKTNAKIPRSYLIRAIMLFNTPAMFGGSAEKSLQNLNKAVSLFERNDDTTEGNIDWGYIESLAWQGRVQASLENYDAALFAYNKALEIEPEFMWVSKNLLPALKKKMSANKN